MEVNSIGPISGGQPVRKAAQPPAQPPVNEPRPVSPKDELELTSVNSASPEVDLETQFREQRIEQIKAQIADGTYETPEKLEAALDRMLGQILEE